MKLTIIVEGYTEASIIVSFLAPYIDKFDKVKVINLKGVGNLKNNFKSVAEKELSENTQNYVLCLVDYHNHPFDDVPAYDAQVEDNLQKDVHYIQRRMKTHIMPDLRERFHPFIVVREVETWALADYEGLSRYFATAIRPYTAPEHVKEAAKTLEKLNKKHKGNAYSKATTGQEIFKYIEAQRVYADNCPHFIHMIDRLQSLQGNAPSTDDIFEDKFQPIYDKIVKLQQEEDEIIDNALKERRITFTPEEDQRIADIHKQLEILQQQLMS